MCMSCGRTIDWDARSCPYCHWPGASSTVSFAWSDPISSRKRVLLYIGSLFLPLFGIVVGAIYLSRNDEDHRSVGTMCLILGVVVLAVLPTILSALLYIMVLGS